MNQRAVPLHAGNRKCPTASSAVGFGSPLGALPEQVPHVVRRTADSHALNVPHAVQGTQRTVQNYVPKMKVIVQQRTYRLRWQRWQSPRRSMDNPGYLYASSVMQLCRSAMETSARTIWLLSDPDRNVRRDRCMSMEMEQLEQQSQFLKLDAEFERRGRNPRPPNVVAMNASHREKHADLTSRVKKGYTFTKPPSFTKTIAHAARWVDAHVPAHDTGELAASGLEEGARSFYPYGSSFVHGYSWMSDYARGGRLFGMIADSLAAALNMTECAVGLYEAACRAPGGRRGADSLVTERLEPTIAQWMSLYI